MKKDYYDILEISQTEKNLSEKEFNKILKSKYRSLSKKYHPDLNPDNKEAEEKFKEISEANEYLSDPQKKANYDRFGHQENQRPNDVDLNDIFSRMFNRGNRQRQQPQKGSNIRVQINLTLEEIFNGVKKEIKYNITNDCSTCNGSGGEKENCNVCFGQGVTTETFQMGNQQFIQQQPCSTCNQTGKTYKTKCSSCKDGKIKESIEEKIDLPSGIYGGNHIIASGKGCKIKSGNNGDLEIVINELKHNNFKRQEHNLFLNLDFKYYELILGCDKEVNTIEGGKIKVNIPKYSKVNSNLRIKGKGMKIYNTTSRGDMYIVLQLLEENELPKEELELLEKIKEKNLCI